MVLVMIFNSIGAISTSAAISENSIHTYSNNTWAWNSLATSPNGDIYLAHKVNSTEIALKHWNGSNWVSLPSITAALAGDTGFSDDLHLVVDAQGNLHLAFRHYDGSGSESHRGVKYGFYDGTAWTFKEIEAYSDPKGWKNFDDPAIAVDSSGKAHFLYLYSNASSHTDYVKYATNSSGSWVIQTIDSGQGGQDELHDPHIGIDGTDTIHIAYVREDNQNTYRDGNYYYAKKGLADANFPSATKLIDAVSENKSFKYSPFVVDDSGKVYVTFSEVIRTSNPSTVSSTSYFFSNASGSWQREQIYFDNEREAVPVGAYVVDSTVYLLMDSRKVDRSNNHFFAMANNGSGWIVGNKTVTPTLAQGLTLNERTFLVDSNGNFMVAMLHHDLREISSLTGTAEDFGLISGFAVTYDGNGNTGGNAPVDSRFYNQGDSTTVLGKADLSKSGSKFVGWNTLENGTGTHYMEGNAFTMGTGNVTLYAAWAKPGDGNGDGIITPADAFLVQQHLNGRVTLTAAQKMALDMDNDQDLDAVDVNLIMKAYLGL
jgi:hypothetical protein